MWLKGLENNKKKNCMFLDFEFETLWWGKKNNRTVWMLRDIEKQSNNNSNCF